MSCRRQFYRGSATLGEFLFGESYWVQERRRRAKRECILTSERIIVDAYVRRGEAEERFLRAKERGDIDGVGVLDVLEAEYELRAVQAETYVAEYEAFLEIRRVGGLWNLAESMLDEIDAEMLKHLGMNYVELLKAQGEERLVQAKARKAEADARLLWLKECEKEEGMSVESYDIRRAESEVSYAEAKTKIVRLDALRNELEALKLIRERGGKVRDRLEEIGREMEEL